LYKRPGIVHGVGPKSATILYLGEKPGKDEAAVRKPFVSGSGRIRNQILRHAGLDHTQMFSSYVVRCHPPGDRKPTEDEIRNCLPFLIKEIKDVDPTLIIAAGELALKATTGESDIGLLRGVVRPGYKDIKIFPTWNPSHIMRQQYNWPFAVRDMVRAKVESTSKEIYRVPFSVVVANSELPAPDDLLRRARRSGRFTFDFETGGLDGRYDPIVMLGAVVDTDTAYVYNWAPRAKQILGEVFRDSSIEICGQNVVSFDIPFAEEKIDPHTGKKFQVPDDHPVFDTMVAFHLCNSSYGDTPIKEQRKGTFRQVGADKNLGFIASLHTDMLHWKGRSGGRYTGDLKEVCGKDCIATDRIAYNSVDGLKRELRRYGMTDLYYKHVMPVQPVLRRMSKRGLKQDPVLAAKWILVLERKAQQMEDELRKFLDKPFLNLQSPQQMMSLLYDELKLPIQYVKDKKKGLRPTADSNAIAILTEKYPDLKPLQMVGGVRHLKKMSSTYIDVRGLDTDGFIHPQFGTSKAANGRLNSWNPNGQNFPRAMRVVYVPRSPEHVFYSIDWSQIEWRLAMVLSGDRRGLELLAGGADVHKAMYSEVMGKHINLVTKAERGQAKFIVYGLGYGRGAASIAQSSGKPIAWVQNYINGFFHKLPQYAMWRGALEDFVNVNHYLGNAFMRRRWWYTRQITEMYNFPPSSTAADMMYLILPLIDKALPNGADLVLTVHDEVVVEMTKDKAAEVERICVEIMQRSWPEIVETSARPEIVRKFYPDGWFCQADGSFGTDWKACKPEEDDEIRTELELRKTLGVPTPGVVGL